MPDGFQIVGQGELGLMVYTPKLQGPMVQVMESIAPSQAETATLVILLEEWEFGLAQ